MARASEVDALLFELKAALRDADQRFVGWSCPTSTDCCRFRVTGREPYVTSIELELIRRAVSATGRRGIQPSAGVGRRARGRRTLPTLHAAVAREGRCPLLSEQGRCTIYDARPLGCRTFWCGRAEPGENVPHRDVVGLVRRVEDIASRHETGGDAGRPLTSALSDARPRARAL